VSKVERIIKLLDLLGRRSEMTIREMSRACGVSTRTIYRYLNTLSSLDLPSRFGHVLENTSGTDQVLGLERDDFELIVFCLGHNLLVRYPYFAQKFERIKKALLEVADSGPESSISILKADTAVQTPISDEHSQYLDSFTQAIQDSKSVRLRTWSEAAPRSVQPNAIRLGRHGPVLIVEFSGSRIRQDVYLSEVASLEVEGP